MHGDLAQRMKSLSSANIYAIWVKVKLLRQYRGLPKRLDKTNGEEMHWAATKEYEVS